MNRYISGKVKKFVFIRDKGKCVYCDSTKNLEFDHIIPATLGGSNTERNIQLVCKKCNYLKYNYIDDEDLKDPDKRLKKIQERELRKKKKRQNLIRYLYYGNTGKSQITIPRKFLEVEGIDWNHNDDLYLSVKEENGKKVVCIVKKKEETK